MAGTGFWWVLGTMALYAVAHSLLASLTAKALAERWLGAIYAQRFYRLTYNLVAVLTLIPPLLLLRLLPDRVLYRLPWPLSLLALLLQGAAAVGAMLAVAQTGALHFLGLAQPFQRQVQPGKLNTGGLYRWVRHPIYSFSLLVLWLTPVMSANFLAFNLAATAYFWIGSVLEERKLILEFGEEYAAYRQRTPMLIPGLRLHQR